LLQRGLLLKKMQTINLLLLRRVLGNIVRRQLAGKIITMAKEKRAFWRKWVWKHLLAGITVLAMSSAAVGKDVVPDEARTRDMMRCQDYLQLDPRAWTPMVIWLMNDPFSLEPPEWTDFHEAELVLTPILTEICRQEPDVWLTSLRERLNSYQQVRSLN